MSYPKLVLYVLGHNTVGLQYCVYIDETIPGSPLENCNLERLNTQCQRISRLCVRACLFAILYKHERVGVGPVCGPCGCMCWVCPSTPMHVIPRDPIRTEMTFLF